jgi:hypothetical protein
MGNRNGYAALVKQRGEKKSKRRRLDDYETPEDATRTLTRLIKFKGPILEPACGSGRMSRELRARTGRQVFGFDIKKGHDFRKRTKVWKGDTVTNPPYRDDLAEIFARQALKLTDGRVCMLFEGKFLWGGKRAAGLYAENKPDHIIIIPERIYFYEAGKQITSQFFNHAWVCWPDRKTRERGNYKTTTHWISSREEF